MLLYEYIYSSVPGTLPISSHAVELPTSQRRDSLLRQITGELTTPPLSIAGWLHGFRDVIATTSTTAAATAAAAATTGRMTS